MGGLIKLPQRLLSQPQYPVRLNECHPLYKDIVFAYSAGRGVSDGKNGAGTVTGTVDGSVGSRGKRVIPANSTSYIGFPHSPDYDTLGEVTIVAVLRTTTSIVSQQGLVTKSQTGGGANTPWALLMESSGSPSLNRSNSGFRVWKTLATLSDNTDYVIAVSQGANISVAPRFYINGAYSTAGTSSLYGGSGSGAPTGNTTSVKIGNRTDLASQSSTFIYDTIVFKRVLTDGEIASLSGNIHQVWKAPDIRIWLPSVASSDGVGSASGSSAVSGVGASVNAQPGSSLGAATVTGTGAASAETTGSSTGAGVASAVGTAVIDAVGSASGGVTVDGAGTSSTGSSGSASGNASVSGVGSSAVDSVGVGNGVASVSGIGGAEALSTASASGVATVSGAGDSAQAGSAVGEAAGTSAVIGVGASVVAASGNVSGASTAQAVSDSGGAIADPSGGDDVPTRVVYKKRKKTLEEQPNKHLESIIDKSFDEILGKKKTVSVPPLTLRKNKGLVVKEAVSVPPLESVSQEVIAEEVEKVAALLAQYQEQVKLAQMQEDEDLLMLIMEMI